MFQNGYYSWRFAFLISDLIIKKLQQEGQDKENVSLIGYGNYSELLLSLTKKLLRLKSDKLEVNHSIADIGLDKKLSITQANFTANKHCFFYSPHC